MAAGARPLTACECAQTDATHLGGVAGLCSAYSARATLEGALMRRLRLPRLLRNEGLRLAGLGPAPPPPSRPKPPPPDDEPRAAGDVEADEYAAAVGDCDGDVDAEHICIMFAWIYYGRLFGRQQDELFLLFLLLLQAVAGCCNNICSLKSYSSRVLEYSEYYYITMVPQKHLGTCTHTNMCMRDIGRL
jgi:hypothetical protein